MTDTPRTRDHKYGESVLGMELARARGEILKRYLLRADGNTAQAAKLLGVTAMHLSRLLRTHKLPQFGAELRTRARLKQRAALEAVQVPMCSQPVMTPTSLDNADVILPGLFTLR